MNTPKRHEWHDPDGGLIGSGTGAEIAATLKELTGLEWEYQGGPKGLAEWRHKSLGIQLSAQGLEGPSGKPWHVWGSLGTSDLGKGHSPAAALSEYMKSARACVRLINAELSWLPYTLEATQ
mgnify:FL=1